MPRNNDLIRERMQIDSEEGKGRTVYHSYADRGFGSIIERIALYPMDDQWNHTGYKTSVYNFRVAYRKIERGGFTHLWRESCVGRCLTTRAGWSISYSTEDAIRWLEEGE